MGEYSLELLLSELLQIPLSQKPEFQSQDERRDYSEPSLSLKIKNEEPCPRSQATNNNTETLQNSNLPTYPLYFLPLCISSQMDKNKIQGDKYANFSHWSAIRDRSQTTPVIQSQTPTVDTTSDLKPHDLPKAGKSLLQQLSYSSICSFSNYFYVLWLHVRLSQKEMIVGLSPIN